MSRVSESKRFAHEVMQDLHDLIFRIAGRHPKRHAVALVESLERAYAQANFDSDIEASGQHWTLDHADICDAIRRAICNDFGLEILTNEEIEAKYRKGATNA